MTTEAPDRTRLRRRHTICFVTCLAGYAWVIVPEVSLRSFDPAWAWASLLVMLVAFWASILLHELGHIVAGISQRFRFVLFAAWFLRVERGATGIRLSLDRRWLNLSLCVPLDGRDVIRRMVVFALGGPAASFMVAAVALLALTGGWLPAADSVAMATLRLAAAALGVSSLYVFLVTTFTPSTLPGTPSDGARARGLLRGDGAAAEAALVALNGLSMAHVRPRDWPVELVELSASVGDSPLLKASASATALVFTLDRGDQASAEAHFRAAIAEFDRLPVFARSGFAAMAAYVECRLHDDAEKARAWLARVDGRFMVDAYLVHLATAAIALASGDAALAHEESQKGLAALPLAQFGCSEMDRELLEDIAERALALDLNTSSQTTDCSDSTSTAPGSTDRSRTRGS